MQTPLHSAKLLSITSKRFVLTALDIQSAPSQSDKLPSDTHPKRIIDLPDDLLIPIFSHCDIDAILSLRLTCTAFGAVVKAYITAIAPASARTTFPDCDLLLRPPKDGYSLRWMINLIPAQLASIVLDKDKLRRHIDMNRSLRRAFVAVPTALAVLSQWPLAGAMGLLTRPPFPAW